MAFAFSGKFLVSSRIELMNLEIVRMNQLFYCFASQPFKFGLWKTKKFYRCFVDKRKAGFGEIKKINKARWCVGDFFI